MCGIFGIINHHKRQLDKRAFITLGCVNDSRGGDACGVMIDRKVERGTAKEDQYFQDWYPKSEVLKNTEKCYVALGHCRKASVGGVAPEKAQPVTIHDSEGNLLFCLIHNGTIYNYLELAKKYIPDVNITGLTDSQVMANIFYYAGYDALGEYEGGGAFVIQDYRTNETFLFKGESIGSLAAVKPVVERPLFFVATGKSIIFSSMFAPLQGLYWGFDVYNVPSNQLLKCDGLSLYVVKEYDRTKCKGYKSYTPVVTKKYNSWADDYEDPNYSSSVPDCVDVDTKSGLYYDTGTKRDLHGEMYISKWGYISTYSTGFNNKYYFWRGIMLSGASAYEAVRDFHAKYGRTNTKKTINRVMALARRLSCNPVVIQGKYYTFDINGKKELFKDEEYHFPLSKEIIITKSNGEIDFQYMQEERNIFVPADLTKEKINKFVDYVKKGL